MNSSFTDIRLTDATVTFLEMHAQPPGDFSSKQGTRFELLSKPVTAADYRFYYYGVGAEWQWLDRMVIPDQELEEKINATNVDIYIMRVNEQPAGFAEFVKEEKYTEILYFGLLPAYVGKGWGKYFLDWVIRKAWSYNPSRIQLNTCTLDHPNALSVYKNSGFIPVRTEVQQRKTVLAI